MVALFDFAIASVLLCGLMLFYQVPLTVYALYAIPIIFALVCCATAAGLFLSAAQVRHRDFTVAVPLLLQIWMFATPIVYPLSAVPSRLSRLLHSQPNGWNHREFPPSGRARCGARFSIARRRLSRRSDPTSLVIRVFQAR